MIQQMQVACPDCQGTGEIINNKDKCKVCNGKKVNQERKVDYLIRLEQHLIAQILEVFIDKGMAEGQTVTFTGEGDQGPDIVPGDVHIQIEQKPHDRFKRKGDDLFYNVEIDLLTALAGGQFAIEHLDDRVLLVNIIQGEVIKPGDVKCIKGEGMPGYVLVDGVYSLTLFRYKRPYDKGNLFVEFTVKFPSPYWTETSKLAMLEKVLPPRTPVSPTPGKEVDEVVLSDVSPQQQHRMEMDDDDEDRHGGGPGVQCAQQ
jgi:DnaJ-class molecular chaperone